MVKPAERSRYATDDAGKVVVDDAGSPVIASRDRAAVIADPSADQGPLTIDGRSPVETYKGRMTEEEADEIVNAREDSSGSVAKARVKRTGKGKGR